MKNTSKTDWGRVDALSDAEIDISDSPPLDDEFFARAKARRSESVPVTVQVDPQALAWFQSQGDEWQRRMSAALRIYAEAHRSENQPAV
ncbi:MAG TPA: BrnA antitoxin family protein [Planctomycetaceae bacterium]